MIKILTRIFIKNSEDVNDPKVRTLYGIVCGVLGITLNIFLFIVKFIAGSVSGSIAITADAVNNLSDAGSSIVTLIGFKMADKKPDTEHPFGHGRIEYISGFIVSMAIILMGFELFKSSFSKLFDKEPLDGSPIIIAILIISIIAKLYMSYYNKVISKKINSSAMSATSLDSFTDSIATFVVLISIIVYKITGYNFDSISGILVSAFILYSGYSAAKDTINPLLGNIPNKELLDSIRKIVLAHKEICGMHDLIVHDYGPGRRIISLHAEIPGSSDIYEIHDCIDRIEVELSKKLNCEAVIHMDPLDINNKEVMNMKMKVNDLVKEYNNELSIHDFRMVNGNTHTNLIFDVVVPFDINKSDEEIKSIISKSIKEKWPNYNAVIKVDKPFV
nr:cation diffusion facilitator family transporter [Clostridium sp. BJN0001]